MALLVMLVAGVLLVAQAQAIMDYIRLYNYTPSADIARLADETAMNDHGRKLFYVNHPVLADRAAFNKHCSHRGEHTIVLGCYHGVDRGIYLFDVTDDRLLGVEQVTAAHEMLHAAYDRLDPAERKRINGLLQEFYASQMHDERLKSTIQAYESSDTADVVNEMHSIFPTEIAAMPPELEAYYARYFTDRSKVVSFAQSYQAEFNSRRDMVKSYDERLKQLKVSMDENNATLLRREQEIESLRSRMEDRRRRGELADYNQQVPVFNRLVESYNALIAQTQGQIDEYNRIVEERNALANEVKGLAQSIDSTLTPIEQ